MDNGKETGNYYSIIEYIVGLCRVYLGIMEEATIFQDYVGGIAVKRLRM